MIRFPFHRLLRACRSAALLASCNGIRDARCADDSGATAVRFMGSFHGPIGACLTAALLAACGGSSLSSLAQRSAASLNGASESAPGSVVGFVYVVNSGAASVSAYKIKSNGALTPVAGSPFGAKGYPDNVAIDPTGNFAYVTDYGASSVSCYAINVTSGALTPLGTATAGYPGDIAVDSTGRFVYVTQNGNFDLWGYTITPSTGVLSFMSGSPFRTTDPPTAVAVDPRSKFAYVTVFDYYGYRSYVSAYSINVTSGNLKKVKGPSFGTGTAPDAVAIDPKSRFAYVANALSDDVSAYTINATSGKLTQVAGSPFGAGTGPADVAIDPSGKFAYVANYGSGDVSAYKINPTSGALTSKGSFAAAGAPEGVAVDPSGKFAYVTNSGSANVSAYSIDARSGALSTVKGSPFEAGRGSNGIATCRRVGNVCKPPRL